MGSAPLLLGVQLQPPQAGVPQGREGVVESVKQLIERTSNRAEQAGLSRDAASLSQIRLALAPQAPLEELNLAGCRGLISVDVVALQLRSVNLTGAFALSTLVLRVPALSRLVIGQCKALEHIAFFEFPSPAEDAAASAARPPPLPALRELLAPGCSRLEEATIHALAVRPPPAPLAT